MKTNTIRFKMNFLYTGTLFMILALFSVFLYVNVRATLYEGLDNELRIKSQRIIGIVKAYAEIERIETHPVYLMHSFLTNGENVKWQSNMINELWQRDRDSLNLDKDYFRITNVRKGVLLRSKNLTIKIDNLLDKILPKKNQNTSYAELEIAGVRYRAINYIFSYDMNNFLLLQLASPLTHVQSILLRLLYFICGGIGIILILTIFTGSFFTGRILKPVLSIIRTADNISQTNLNDRVPVDVMDNEMLSLVNAFNNMIARLEQSFQHINQFSSHVAHELKTPLAIIKGELELALSKTNTPEENHRVMTVALQEIDQLIRVIKDILLLAKLDYKTSVFKFEVIDISGFITDIAQHGEILAAQSDIKLTVSLPPKKLLVNADPIHLRRLFFNLIHNAIKFTPQKGQIHIRVTAAHKQALIAVEDSGCGIGAADQQRIFEKFFRVHRPDQTDSAGSGLGLSIALSIARAHGGTIQVKSELQKGSTFTVILPVVPA